MAMSTISDITEALKRLTAGQRRQVATWIYGYTDEADRVAEPAAPAYEAIAAQRLSVEDYLKLEENSELRHEYVAGEVFAMSAPSLRHEKIVMNLGRELSNRTRNGPCSTFVSKVKVHIKSDRNEFFYYPDVLVACGRLDLQGHCLEDPKLIIEVLSPSTASTDRREKAQNYRAIPTLEEYILVTQDELELTIQRRAENWVSQVVVGPDTVAEFRSIPVAMPLQLIYEGLQQ